MSGYQPPQGMQLQTDYGDVPVATPSIWEQAQGAFDKFKGGPGQLMPGSYSNGSIPGVSTEGGMFSSLSMFGGTAADGTKSGGWVSPALNTFTGLTSAWLGMQQYGLAKDALKESKKQFKYNANNQAQTINTEMKDRQIARLNSAGSGASNYQSVGDYMKDNEVKGYA